ncbi:MAG: cellulase family glycosylhydrolase [Planctomycetota bacterium]
MDVSRLAAERPTPPIVRGVNTWPSGDPEHYAEIARWGANCIRLLVLVGGTAKIAKDMEKDFWDAWPAILDRVEKSVRLAKEAGLKVIVDLHNPPIPNLEARDTKALWEHPDLEKSFCRAWKDLAQRLLPHKEAIWAYDLYNEPLDWGQFPKAPKQWRPLAIKIIETIRTVDPDVWIVYEVGPGSWYRGFDGLVPLPDYHVIYGGHFYHPQAFTYQGAKTTKGTDLAEAMEKINVRYPSAVKDVRWDKKQIEKMHEDVEKFRRQWKVPIFIGEFSVVRWAPKEDALHWLQDVLDTFEANGYSWAYHAFRTYNGWSLEHDETFWMPGAPPPEPSKIETERAKLVKAYLKRNRNQAEGKNP